MQSDQFVDVFVTDYETVRIGPIFSIVLASIRRDLEASSRTKRYKKAKSELIELESTVNCLARLHWIAGKTLDQTP